MVKKGKEECKRGNIFQVVLSREFIQDFKGDEFNLYRALRSVNPSPYLFYFDYGNFKIFGSSLKKNSADLTSAIKVLVTNSAPSIPKISPKAVR